MSSSYTCISQCMVQKMSNLKHKLLKEVLVLGVYLNLYHILHPNGTHTEYWFILYSLQLRPKNFIISLGVCLLKGPNNK